MNRLFYSRVALLLVGMLMLFSHLEAIFPSIMEARNFVSAREMLASHDWLHTTLNGLPRYEKPPLPTWITALFGAIFGTDNLVALRIPNAFITLLAGIYAFRISRLIFKEKMMAFYSAYVFFTLYLILYVGKSNVWDTYCYAFMWIGIYYFLKSQDSQRWRYWILFALCTAASMLSKGPMGVLILFIPFFVGYFVWVNPRFFSTLDWPKAIVSVLLILILGMSWYAYIYYDDHDTFMQIFEKEAEARVHRNVKPWYRYLSFTVQSGIWVLPATLGLFLGAIRKKLKFSNHYWWILVWVLGGVFILSLFPEKKERYLFPIMFPLSLLIGRVFYLWNDTPQFSPKWIRTLRNIFYILIALMAISLMIGVPAYIKAMSVSMVAFCFLMLMISLSMVGALMRSKFHNLFKYTVYWAVVVNILLLPMVLPKVFNNPQPVTVESIQSTFDLPLYGLDSYTPEIWFTYHHLIPDYSEEEINQGVIPEDEFLLMRIDESKDQVGHLKDYEILATIPFDENWVLPNTNNYSERKFGKIYHLKKKIK